MKNLFLNNANYAILNAKNALINQILVLYVHQIQIEIKIHLIATVSMDFCKFLKIQELVRNVMLNVNLAKIIIYLIVLFAIKILQGLRILLFVHVNKDISKFLIKPFNASNVTSNAFLVSLILQIA
jgi:hypothetical protein